MSNRVDMDLAVKRVRESKVYLEAAAFMKADERHTVSYTHLTLPTILRV